MRRASFASVLLSVLLVVGLVSGGIVAVATAGHNDDDEHSENFKQLARKPIKIEKDVFAEGSDLAFSGNKVIAGSFQGLGVFKILQRKPFIKQLGFGQCLGGQGDVTVFGKFVFFSVDSPRVGPGCTPDESAAATSDRHVAGQAWEGLRIFSIEDPTRPRQVAAIDISCGSHTNTLLPGETKSYIYVNSYPLGAQGQDCSVASHRKVQIVEFPNSDPSKAKLLDKTIDVSPMIGCHDFTTFPDRDLLAGACVNQSRIWDISDPTAPELLSTIQNEQMQIHHSTAMTWDGKILVLGDEYGGAAGGGGCTGDEDSTVGAAWFYDVSDPSNPQLLGSHSLARIPDPPDDTREGQNYRCTNHNFNVIPVRNGKYLLAVSYYMGGISIVDFTDPTDPTEIAYYVNKPGGVQPDTWAAYWYNGRIYTNDFLSKLGVGVYRFKGTTNQTQTRFFKGDMNPQVQFDSNLRP